MKKLTDRTLMKIVAVIVSYIAVLAIVFSVGATVIMGYYKFYFSNEETVRQEILTDMAEEESYYIHQLLDSGRDLEKYYSDKNVYYVITDVDSGETVCTNYNGEKYQVEAENTYYYYYEIEKVDESGNYFYEHMEKPEFDVAVYIAEDMKHNDIFSVAVKIVEIGFKLQYTMVFIAIASLLVLIALLCFLYCSAGHKDGVIRLNALDRIPFDVCTAFIIAAALFSVITVCDWADGSLIWVVYTFFVLTADYFLALGYTMSFATRIKTATLFKNNIITFIFKFLYKHLSRFFRWLGYILKNLSLIKKTLLFLVAVLLLEAVGLIIAFNTYWYAPELLVFLIIAVNIIFITASLYFALTMHRIKSGGERIAGGDLSHKISTEYMYGDFKHFCDSLNNINEGLQTAINERMKSERFKTELITNVSHDIKTPLTSIINYVDLIKKEEVEVEKVKEYIEVLDRQSTRLKKLVEDLVEASKASAGTLPVSLTACDASVLLSQAIGEFDERLKKAGIVPVITLPEESLKIKADGRHLWRVFDNLLSNICKYAMSGTRVYLDVRKKDNMVQITFRNISKYQLNVSAEELMERFVRGDSSRNTEGSGLGLSIAKSLVELQGGKMQLQVDGDLFKVTVEFEEMP